MSTKRAYYDFGETTFRWNVWISGGSTFYNPRHLDIEKTTNHRITLEIYDSNSRLVSTHSFPTGYRWQSADLSGLARGKRYKFKLVNPGSGTVIIKQGQLAYEQQLYA